MFVYVMCIYALCAACVYVCVCVCVLNVCVCVHMCDVCRMCVGVCVCVSHLHISMCMYCMICVYACLHMCKCIFVCVCVNVCDVCVMCAACVYEHICMWLILPAQFVQRPGGDTGVYHSTILYVICFRQDFSLNLKLADFLARLAAGKFQ